MRLCFLKHAKSKYVRGLKIAIKYLQLEQCADSGKVCANEGLEFSGKFITNDRHCSQSRRGLFTPVHSVNEDRQQPIDGGESPRDDSPRENVTLYDVRYCIKIRMIKST